MALASPTVAELATFTGRASNTFGPFAVEALAQATLLFYLATEMELYPADESLARLAKYGIMDMADKLYLSQPYQQTSASPYQSETIGSYSYSKATQAVKKGNDTGVMWFDLAVNKLSRGTTIGSTGSIEGMEWDGLAVGQHGKAAIVGGSGTYSSGAQEAWSIDTNRIEVDPEFLL